MPNTANRAYPYPAPSAAPNVPADMQSLANAVDADVAAYLPRTIVKTNDTARSSNATVAADSGTGTVLAGISLAAGTYEVEVVAFVSNGAATGDLKTQWGFTGTLTGTPRRACLGPGPGNAATPEALTPMRLAARDYNADATYGLGASTSAPAAIRETAVVVVSVAGNLSFNWAQNTSDATATNLLAQSRISIRKVN